MKILKLLSYHYKKLNDWEENFIKKEIPDTTFLTIPTAEGLRVTLQSSLDIVRLLTEKYGFPAVPTGRINQDSLERFLAQLDRQVDPMTIPTFSHFFYRFIKSYHYLIFLKPPKSGNCTVTSKEPLVTLSELKSIYSQKSSTESIKITEALKKKLIEAVKIDNLEDNDFNINLDHDYNESQTLDCILYYATEVVVSRIYKSTTCEQCQKGIRDCSVYLSEDDYLNFNIKSDQPFMHPNQNFYFFIKNSKFPCPIHAGELLLSAITYYIRLRMQQYTSQMNKSNKKQNQLKKKQAKFCSS
ncbi:hypothetical protein KQX54_013404 [Cotesia glomerata]|uniref:Uncharacterized protein n=1 Tax=Cotesia glomerata TaxID=32391 RepID=A0AAV7I379_COTGL|nr:hypothetical protein KQX54_013404 [Cotesia glomerata]